MFGGKKAAAAGKAAADGTGRDDRLFGRESSGAKPALVAAGLGIANAALLLRLCYKPVRNDDEKPEQTV